MGHPMVVCYVTAGQMVMWMEPESELLTVRCCEYLTVMSMVCRRVSCLGHWMETQRVLYYATALPMELLMEC